MGKTKIKDIKNPDIRKKPYCKRIGYKKIFKLWKKGEKKEVKDDE